MALDLRAAVRETWERALDEERAVSVPDVADRVIESFPALYEVERERLGREALIRWIKALAREETDAAGQLSLFGFPATIAVPNGADDEYAYMRSVKATWPDIEAGELVRQDNVSRAVAKLDQYRGAKERVRPLMEGTERTLAEAIAAMALAA